MNSNLINVAVPAATLKEVNDAIDVINTKLAPFLDEKIEKEILETMQKLGERSEPFTRRAIEIAEKEPGFIPAYLSLAEAKLDLECYLQFKDLASSLRQMSMIIETNGMLAGAEALDFANDFYRNIRFLSKNSNQRAKDYFEELSDRYASVGRRRKGQQPMV